MPQNTHLPQLRQHLLELQIGTTEVSEGEIAVPAAHADVGPISIHLENRELVVWLGVHFHTHFALPQGNGDDLRRVAGFISDFVTERSLVSVTTDRSATSAYLQDAETGEVLSHLAFPKAKQSFWSRLISPLVSKRKSTQSFKWSGPLPSPVPPIMDPAASALADKVSQMTVEDVNQLAEYLRSQATESDSDPDP